jgi:hypothetical protein
VRILAQEEQHAGQLSGSPGSLDDCLDARTADQFIGIGSPTSAARGVH